MISCVLHSLTLHSSSSVWKCIPGRIEGSQHQRRLFCSLEIPTTNKNFKLFWKFGSKKKFSDTKYQRQWCHRHYRRTGHFCPGGDEVMICAYLCVWPNSSLMHSGHVSVSLRSPPWHRERDRWVSSQAENWICNSRGMSNSWWVLFCEDELFWGGGCSSQNPHRQEEHLETWETQQMRMCGQDPVLNPGDYWCVLV